MAFFNSKQFELVDVTNQEEIELGSANTLSFYIRDILSGTAITSIDYLVVSKSGRSDTIIGSYVNITDIAGDIYKFAYTPSGVTAGSTIKFRLKITDTDGDDHIIYTDDFLVISAT